jgi:hypothetical protein
MKQLTDEVKSKIKCVKLVSEEVLSIVKNECPSDYDLKDHCTNIASVSLYKCAVCWEQALDEIE